MTVGTIQREGVYVRGVCPRCVGGEDEGREVLVYEAADGTLICAGHMRIDARVRPRRQRCDECGSAANVSRSRANVTKNEYYCEEHQPPRKEKK